MAFRISRALSERPIAGLGAPRGDIGSSAGQQANATDGGVMFFLQRELVPIVRELLRALTAPPTAFTWDANAAALDVSRGSDFVASAQLTGDSTLTLTGGYDGAQGAIVVQQNAAGGHLLSFVVDGGTVVREDPAVDSNPNPSPSSLTRYRYLFATVNGAPYLIVERLYLL